MHFDPTESAIHPSFWSPVRWQSRFAALIAVGLVVVAGAASADVGVAVRSLIRRQIAALPAQPTASVAIGLPSRGRLQAAVQMRESETVRFKSGSLATERWGTEELVSLVQGAASHVSRVLPGGRLTVGDLSRQRGGRMRPHRSHRNGRDVDIVFYAIDAQGNPVEPNTFVQYRPDGSAYGSDGWRFDDARNWELIASLITDARVHVQYIFVSRGIRARLLAEASNRSAPPELVERAARLLYQPRRGGAHRDHYHLRIYCPPDDRPSCVDEPPYWTDVADPFILARAALTAAPIGNTLAAR